MVGLKEGDLGKLGFRQLRTAVVLIDLGGFAALFNLARNHLEDIGVLQLMPGAIGLLGLDGGQQGADGAGALLLFRLHCGFQICTDGFL